MRIAMINTTADSRRAPSRLMLRVAAAAEGAGHSVTVAWGRGRAELPEGVDGWRIGSGTDMLSHYLRSRMADGQALGSARATADLIRRLEAWQPDVVHLHNLHGHYLNLPMLARWLAGSSCRVVVTLHDYWLLTGHCAFAPGGCTLWRQGCRGGCPGREAYPATLLSRAAHNWQIKHEALRRLGERLTLVPVSATLGADVAASAFGGLRSEVIPNGVEIAAEEPPSEGERTLILAVGSPTDPRKGIADLRALVPLLHPGERIVVAGGRSAHTAHGISCLGAVSHADLLALYRRAKVAVSCSRAETFGMSVMEALAAGTPVVTRRLGVFEELLGGNPDPRIARMTDTADPQQLRRAIDELALTACPEACRAHAAGYSAEAMCRRYLDLYQHDNIRC